ncbi:MAG TPA: pectin acetylesterase-family hydrolase, partial [Acidimicrobiales bacterium]|nr:pectin acetylesterase-family hydrolase [Acidimicrobiales bacterium]
MAFDSRMRLIVTLAIAPVLSHCSSSSNPSFQYNSGSGSGAAGAHSGSGSASSGSGNELGDDLSSGSESGSGSTEGSGSTGDDTGPTGDDAGPTGDDAGPTGMGNDASAPGNGGSCPGNAMYPQTTFVPLGVKSTTAFTKGQSDAIPGVSGKTAPAGWDFHQSGLCRDGSPAGFYAHFSTASSTKLWIYLEGGGACDSATFCTHNPANIAQVFSGGAASQGQTIGGSLGFDGNGFQQPYVASNGYSPGIFDFTNSANPFKDWNAVYVPYCTGDVHFGTVENVDIPDQGLTGGVKAQ